MNFLAVTLFCQFTCLSLSRCLWRIYCGTIYCVWCQENTNEQNRRKCLLIFWPKTNNKNTLSDLLVACSARVSYCQRSNEDTSLRMRSLLGTDSCDGGGPGPSRRTIYWVFRTEQCSWCESWCKAESLRTSRWGVMELITGFKFWRQDLRTWSSDICPSFQRRMNFPSFDFSSWFELVIGWGNLLYSDCLLKYSFLLETLLQNFL